MLLLVIVRPVVAEAFVQAGGVVPADVLDDGELELAASAPTRSAIRSVLRGGGQRLREPRFSDVISD
jgi:hypothetical protein